ncbi:MAG: DMT family transporter [Pseudomonadota bacterium]
MTGPGGEAGAARGLAPNVQGALWLVLAALVITIMFAAVKVLDGRYNAFQITFIRAAAALVLVPPILMRIGLDAVRPRKPGLLLLRSIAGTLTIGLSYVALPYLPLADVQAISFASVLFVVPLAALFLGERIGPRRWAAALIGFAGVLIMLRPSATMNVGAVAALASAFFFSVTVITVRRLSRTMHPEALLFYGMVLMTLLSAAPAAVFWKTPTAADWGLFALIAATGAISQFCYIRAYAVAEASAIGPMEYLKLIFATGLGYALFDETLSLWTAAGAATIVGATLYISWREATLARRRPQRPEPPPTEGQTQ